MREQPVESESWKLHPMPEQTAELHISRTCSFAECERITRGYAPQGDSDKWLMYAENHLLSIHRRRTGNCIYQVEIEQRDNDCRISRAWVNRHPDQHRSRDDDQDTALLLFLIDYFLLEKDVEIPIPKGKGAAWPLKAMYEEAIIGHRRSPEHDT